MLSSLIVVSAAAKQLKMGCWFNATEIFSINSDRLAKRDAMGIKTFRDLLHDIQVSFVQE